MLTLESITLKERLQSVSCVAKAGDIVHLLGANGAGKSSLLHVISGIQAVDSGTIDFNSVPIINLSALVLAGFRCLQLQQEALAFDIEVIESIDFVTDQKQLPELLAAALEIQGLLARRISMLSGGERQRVEITRCLLRVWPSIMAGEALILLDEPFKGMDFRHQHLLSNLLSQLAKIGNHIIVSHHDLNLCQQYADQVWLLKQGRLLTQGTKEDVLTQNWLQIAFDCKLDCAFTETGKKIFQTYI